MRAGGGQNVLPASVVVFLVAALFFENEGMADNCFVLFFSIKRAMRTQPSPWRTDTRIFPLGDID